METDSGFWTRPYYCFVEWLSTCSNLDEYAPKLHSDDRNAASQKPCTILHRLYGCHLGRPFYQT